MTKTEYGYKKPTPSRLPLREFTLSLDGVRKIRAESFDDLKEQVKKALETQLDWIAAKIATSQFALWRQIGTGMWLKQREYEYLQQAPTGYGMVVFSYYSCQYGELAEVYYYVPGGSLAPPPYFLTTDGAVASGEVIRRGASWTKDENERDVLCHRYDHLYENFFREKQNTLGWIRVSDNRSREEVDQDIPLYLRDI